MSGTITSSVAAASLAVANAGLDIESVDRTRCGVVFGSEMLYGPPGEIGGLYATSASTGQAPRCDAMSDFGSQMGEVFPLWLLKYLPNMAACHIGIAQGITGPNNSIVQGDVSGLLALIEARSVIERQAADLMFTGGTGTMLLEARTCNLTDKMFAQSFDDPARASRPFDRDREGQVAGEGAGAFVLESAELAEERGAKPLAIIEGVSRVYGCGGNAPAGDKHDEFKTSVQAVERSITLALKDAACSIDDIDHVNAHATSQKKVDACEAQAIRNVLGDVPVTAVKSYMGNMGAGSSAVEIAASLWAMQSGLVPPTLNYENEDPDCPVNVISGAPKPFEKPLVLKLSQSTSGQAAAVVLRKA